MNKRLVGFIGETLVINFLQNKGWKLICRNFFIEKLEIDIVMEKKDRIIFLEVRTASLERDISFDKIKKGDEAPYDLIEKIFPRKKKENFLNAVDIYKSNFIKKNYLYKDTFLFVIWGKTLFFFPV